MTGYYGSGCYSWHLILGPVCSLIFSLMRKSNCTVQFEMGVFIYVSSFSSTRSTPKLTIETWREATFVCYVWHLIGSYLLFVLWFDAKHWLHCAILKLGVFTYGSNFSSTRVTPKTYYRSKTRGYCCVLFLTSNWVLFAPCTSMV